MPARIFSGCGANANWHRSFPVQTFLFFRVKPTRSVLIEALACGLPVAAYPVPGPLDVIADSGAGALDVDLRSACLAALEISREQARAHALSFTWKRSAEQFLTNIRHAHTNALGMRSSNSLSLLMS
jgi:glycosyltransferase involved in cell wall biosynthesis